jgi:NAD-dependent SIR2 family protein deacetylase
MRHAAPNAGHVALAALDPDLLITQNVDGLHEAAGSRRVVALHGRIADVICLSCRRTSSRAALATRMVSANPGHTARHADAEVRPDGDVELDDTAGFVVPDCSSCGGVLKPDVVFFGENVPPERVQRCYAAVDALTPDDALLVVGSSLTVMSGLRFVRRAAKAGVPVAIVNRGTTRGDELATVKIDAGCSEFLTALVEVRSGPASQR